jgi:hypothetical protein
MEKSLPVTIRSERILGSLRLVFPGKCDLGCALHGFCALGVVLSAREYEAKLRHGFCK